MASLDDYLVSLSDLKVPLEIMLDLKRQIQSLTIDQLEVETEKAASAIQQLKNDFAKTELTRHLADSAQIIKVHNSLFSHRLDEPSLLRRFQASNANVQAALSELRCIQKLEQFSKEHKLQECRKNYLERMIDVVSTPWTLNQCLLARQYPQAVQLILAWEHQFPEPSEDSVEPLIIALLRKEVKFLKLKLTKTLFMMLETSYLPRGEKFYTTQVLLQLVKMLGEKPARVNEILLRSRAKHLREYTQSKVMETKKIDPLLKPYLDSAMLIFKEFNDLGVPKEECIDWLYDRYSEVRKLIKALLKPANQSAKTKVKSDPKDPVGFDTLCTLDQLVRNSTLNFQSAAEPEVIIELCVGDLLLEHLMKKAPLCASQLLTIVKAADLTAFPDEKLNAYLEGLLAKVQ